MGLVVWIEEPRGTVEVALFDVIQEAGDVDEQQSGLIREEEVLLVRRSQQQVAWLQALEEIGRLGHRVEVKMRARKWLSTAPVEAKENREVVLAADTLGRGALYYASTALKADRDFILAVVAQNGLALQHA